MSAEIHPRHNSTKLGVVAAVLFGLALVCVAGGFAFLVLSNANPHLPTSQNTPQLAVSEESFEPPVATTTITLTFAGDCTLGTEESFNQSTSFNAYYDSEGADYFFANVKGIFEADDLSVVNCEGVLTTATTREDKQFAYKGRPEFAQILSGSSIEAADVSNNHCYDYGWNSRSDTIDALRDAGVIAFGDDLVGYTEVKGKTIALIGGNMLSTGLGETNRVIPRINDAIGAGADIIIVQMHWGEMESYNPTDAQIQLAHECIDAGATLVVGSHQHVLQGYEEYNGRYIVYGLGNFCYGGSRNLFDPDCYIFQQTFTFANDELQDDSDKTIYPCLISSDRSVNNYQPMLVDGEDAERIWGKIEESSEYARSRSAALFG